MNNVLFNNGVVANYNQRGQVGVRQRPRQFRHRRSQLLDVYTEEEIRDRYRFRRDSIEFICDLVYDDLVRPTQRNRALSVETQVLAGLRFLASGCFYQVIGDVLGIHKSSVSRVVMDFCAAILKKKGDFINFPYTQAERDQNKQRFFEMGGFPSCILCIDCFHVRVATPFFDENDFVNRKGYHSINV